MNEIALCLPKGENLKRIASILKDITFPRSEEHTSELQSH